MSLSLKKSPRPESCPLARRDHSSSVPSGRKWRGFPRSFLSIVLTTFAIGLGVTFPLFPADQNIQTAPVPKDSGLITVARQVTPSDESNGTSSTPSIHANAFKGNLAILGIRPASLVDGSPLPTDTFPVMIPITPSDREAPKTPADLPPTLSGSSTSPKFSRNATDPSVEGESRPEGEDLRFICLLNHLPESEINLLLDAKDGRWDGVSFLDAVLIADGLSDEDRAICRSIYLDHLEKLRNETRGMPDDLPKIRKVFEFLHREVLTGSYNLNYSSAATSLQTGVYNCVSATVLFNAFAGDVGLDSYGLEMTGHAKSRVFYGDQYLDIETTCPHWEILPDKPVAIAQSMVVSRPITGSEEKETVGALEVPEDVDSPITPDKAVTLAGKRPVRPVTPVQFVATIYYNRAVDYYQNGNYDKAITSYLKAVALDPDNKTVLGNLKATINNLAIELASRKKNYAEAIRLTEQGLALDPDFDQFKANLPLYYRHWAEDLRKNNRIDEARQVEDRMERRLSRGDRIIF